jgi:hypothetical protein
MHRLLLLLGLFAAAPALAQGEPLPDLPDPLGRAGMMAAVLRESDGTEVIVAAGGTNFPDKPLWQGGIKKYHGEILKLAKKADGWRWSKVGYLPEGIVGAAFCPTLKRDGLVIAGGAAKAGHRSSVLLVSLDGKVSQFGPDLPTARAYGGFAVADGKLHILGGTDRPDAVTALGSLLSLDLDHPEQGWSTLAASPDFGRIIPVAAGDAGRLLWGGGCSLAEKDGAAFRTYHKDLGWLHASERQATLPTMLAGAAGPGVTTRTHVIFVGGDDGAQYGHPHETHTGLTRRILAVNLRTLATSDLGAWPHPIAVTPLLRLGDDLVTLSGEMRPGVRTPKLTRWTIPAEYR